MIIGKGYEWWAGAQLTQSRQSSGHSLVGPGGFSEEEAI